MTHLERVNPSSHDLRANIVNLKPHGDAGSSTLRLHKETYYLGTLSNPKVPNKEIKRLRSLYRRVGIYEHK